MAWTSTRTRTSIGVAALAAAMACGCALPAREPPPPGGGGGGGRPIYQADRQPDAFAARRHMAEALRDAGKLNLSLVRGDWARAGVELDALRGDLRLGAMRGTLDQQTRVIVLDGRAIEVASAIARRDPAALRLAGLLVRDVVAYHEAYAWGLVDPRQTGVLGGGGGLAAPATPAPVHTPMMEMLLP